MLKKRKAEVGKEMVIREETSCTLENIAEEGRRHRVTVIYHLTQLLRGHGYFQYWLHRTGKSTSPNRLYVLSWRHWRHAAHRLRAREVGTYKKISGAAEAASGSIAANNIIGRWSAKRAEYHTVQRTSCDRRWWTLIAWQEVRPIQMWALRTWGIS